MTVRRVKAFALATAIIPISALFWATPFCPIASASEDDCAASKSYNEAVKPVHRFLSQIQQSPGDNYVNDNNNPIVEQRAVVAYQKLGEILRDLSGKVSDADYKAAVDAHADAVDEYIQHLNDDIARGQAPGEDRATRAAGKKLGAANQARMREAAKACQ